MRSTEIPGICEATRLRNCFWWMPMMKQLEVLQLQEEWLGFLGEMRWLNAVDSVDCGQC